MGAPVTVEELEIVIRAKVGEALAGMQQVINRMDKLINQQIPQLQPKLDAAMQKADRVIDRDADKIIASIDRLADAQGDLNRRLEQTADRYDEALENAQDFLGGVLEGMAEGMNEVAKNTDQAGKKTEQYGKKAEQVTRKAGKNYNWLTGQIRGMIVSMALYGVIDLFTTSISTAATEMAKLDEETNEMLSSYKSSFEYAQMSFGTSMLPLLEAAEPLVTSIADGFAEVSNYIGMFFAALNGQTTYNKVIKKTADYLEDTADAAEEVKRSIAGFDELNIIGQEDAASGWELEEVEIPKWMQKLGEYIDAEDLAMVALGMTALGLVTKIATLISKFRDKNTTLDEQTRKTQADAKAVKELAESFTPALLGAGDLTNSLVSLGALTVLPTLDLSLFDESTGRMLESIDLAADRLDELGLLRPAPQMDNAPMEETVEAGKTIIDDYNAYEVNGKVAEMDNTPLMESADATEQRIAELDEVNPAQKIMPGVDLESEFNPSAQDITQTVGDLNALEFEQMVFKAIETTGLVRSVGEIDSLLGQIVTRINETISAYNQLQQAIGGSSAQSSYSNYVSSVTTDTSNRTTGYDRVKMNATVYGNQQNVSGDNASTKQPLTNGDVISKLFGEDGMKGASLVLGTEDPEEIAAGVQAIITMGSAVSGVASYVVNKAASAANAASEVIDAASDVVDNAAKTATILPTIPTNTPTKAPATGKSTLLSEIQRYLKPAAYGAVAFKPTPLLTGEYPGASMNPEIVAPQSMMYDTVIAANGELVSALHSMIREVITAIEDNSGGDLYIDGQRVTETVINGIKAQKRRTGKNPI